MRKKSQPVPISGILGKTFSGKPLEKRLREGEIWQVWDSAVGEQVASKARPLNIRDGVLTVVVSNAPWMQQLNFLKKGIVAKINAAVGEDLVTEIFLKAGRPVKPEHDSPSPRRRPRTLSDAEKEHIERETSSLDNQELREAFMSLLAKHLANTPTKR